MISRQDFLKTLLAGAAASALPFRALAGSSRPGPNRIVKENSLPGTTGWQLTHPAENGEIQAYVGADSIVAGGELDVFVSTKSPSFDLEIFRLGYYQGKGAAIKLSWKGLAGHDQGCWNYGDQYPSGHSAITSYKVYLDETNIVDANWKKSASITIPANWVSGVYLVKVTESKTGKQWHAPFVVRNDSATASILFKVPFHTDQAYNIWGGVSAYDDFRAGDGNNRATYHSYNRPYWFAYGTQNLFLWEYPMFRFLEEMGYDVLYTTNMAIASGKTNLLHARALITAGHDEYVSQNERLALERANKQGVSLGYFGANNVYWQVRETVDFKYNPDRVMICYKESYNEGIPQSKHVDPVKALGPLNVSLTTDLWKSNLVNYPEALLLKQEWLAECKPFHADDMVVTNTTHWMFKGTGLKDGDKISNVIGGETDYVDVMNLTSSQTATVVAKSPFLTNSDSIWTCTATLTEDASNNSLVFGAGTFFWPVALTEFRSYLFAPPGKQPCLGGWPVVPKSDALRQMTVNLLNRMISPAKVP